MEGQWGKRVRWMRRYQGPLVLCWWHLAVLVLLQIENTLVYGIASVGAGLVSQLLFRQIVLYATSLALACGVYLAMGAHLGAVAVFLANGFCVCEQVAFKLNGVHTKPSMAEQAIGFRAFSIVLGSFIAELDLVFAFNVGFLVISACYLRSIGWIGGSGGSGRGGSGVACAGSLGLLPGGHQKAHMKRAVPEKLFPRASLVFLGGCIINAGYLLLSLSVLDTSHTRLEPHPLLVFASDVVFGAGGSHRGGDRIFQVSGEMEDLSGKPRNSLLFPQLADAPIHGTYDIGTEEQAWMADLRKHVAADRAGRSQTGDAHKPLVVISVVFESVGAKNVFPYKAEAAAGKFDPLLTPTLAAMQSEGGLVFTAQHDIYPSTMRSHVPMFTGGPSMTMGSIDDQMAHVYQGPTLTKWFKAQGFRTGIFAASDLGFESLDTWYQNLGFHKFYHWGNATNEYKARTKLNSWGGTDHSMYSVAAEWVEAELEKNKEAVAAGKAAAPIYVHLLPDATHHPYSVPDGPEWQDQRPFPGESTLDNYKNALHYTDTCLGQMRSRLEALGLADRMVFVVTGDHGEAFGEPAGHHANNFLHKNHLYEENIRSFLMLHGPALKATPAPPSGDRVSHRISRVIDLFPTVAAFVSGKFDGSGDPNLPAAAMMRVASEPAMTSTNFSPGQSLLSPRWSLRLAYFHRAGSPYEWGVLDGRYKFIENQQDLAGLPIATWKTAVYDLLDDPGERLNLATRPEFATKIESWRAAVATNYWAVHCAFTTRLQDYEVAHTSESGCENVLEMERNAAESRDSVSDAVGIDMPSVTHSGPKVITFGGYDNKEIFLPVKTVARDASLVVVFTEWIPFEVDTPVLMEWRMANSTSDSNANSWSWAIEAGWHTTYFNVRPNPLPMAAGTWELVIWTNDPGKPRQELGRKGVVVA